MMIGQTIAHYKILEKLGEGGMGVVYKALDTKLDRMVALKFMPHHITPDDAEEARFLQEAKAASALNHPNVCTIYGIHEHEGTKFIEMEFVEGVTLRHKLPVKALGEAIGYAVQMADALNDAHQKGIVHRDIKADNIMVNSKNQVKVMDFGLAKLKGSLKITKATSTVGTLAYMAPEQIQGGDVDGRSDIFSFGVVLYEMLTGRLPFRSEHEAALMYSIINDEPDPIQKHRDDLPPVLVNMISRALEKDPNERFQSMNEMVIELRRLQKQSTKVSRASLAAMPAYAPAPSAAEAVAPSGSVATPRTGSRTMMLAGAGLLLVFAAAAAWFLLIKSPSRKELNPAMAFRAVAIPYQQIGTPDLSRDGGWIAFPALRNDNTWDVYMMNANSGEPRQITTDSSGSMGTANFSPDGSQIAYDRADKAGTRPEIAVVSSLGGFSKRVVDLGFLPRWRPDGERLGYLLVPTWGSKSGMPEVRSVKANGTDDRLEFADSAFIGQFAWSPDGASICYSRRDEKKVAQLVVRELASAKVTVLPTPQRAYALAWTNNDEIVFDTEVNGNTNLWTIPASGGTPLQITRGTGPDGAASVSTDMKRLLYTQQQVIAHVWTGSIAEGTAQQRTFDDAQLADVRFSPDGSRVLFVETKSGGSKSTASLVTLGLKDGARSTLLSEETNIHAPLWSPDGKWIAFAVHADTVQHDSARTYLIDAENPGTMRLLGSGFPQTWIGPDALLVKYQSGTYLQPLDGASRRLYYKDSLEVTPVLGGSQVLYAHTVYSLNPGLFLAPLDGSAPPRLLMKSLSIPEYDEPGKAIYYLTLQSEFRRMTLPDGADAKVAGTFPGLSLAGGGFALSADGKQIAYLDSKRVSKLMLIDNLH
jgi:Tol biopolymer transport system component